MSSTKERVLRALLSGEQGVSGGDLARQLGLSRSAVWKAIQQLRAEGYDIQAATNRGYYLRPGQDVFSAAEIAGRCGGGEIGRNMEFHREIDSTNIRAKVMAIAGAEHGTVVLAERQQAGHGRFGRAFYSPENSGVYLSIILRPKLAADRAVLTTAMAAVAVARAVEAVADVRAEIKWVNDVYIVGRKVCGILCEAGLDFESGQMQYVVMGIGVNVAPMVFPPELASIATSISNEWGKAVSRSAFTAALLDEINALYPQLETGAFMEEYRERSNVIGREITVLRGDERYSAVAMDIDGAGSLIVQRADGVIETLHSGEISLRFQ